MLTPDARPATLDVTDVLESFRPQMLARIRSFCNTHSTPYEDYEDCMQDILYEMTRVSAKVHSSYLQRYDATRGSAYSYVMTFVFQQMTKRHNRVTRRLSLLPEPLSLSGGEDSLSDPLHNNVDGDRIPDPDTIDGPSLDSIEEPNDLRRFLQGTEFSRPTSCSARGEPRSTLRMLELHVWEGLSIPEIARRMGVTPNAVRGRFHRLRDEPWAQRLARAQGVLADSGTTL